MSFAQLVVGPPGTGKSTYCHYAKEYLQSLKREVIIVNLDPSSDNVDVDIDIRDLISVSEVMERLSLGPNGALMFCMEYLRDNLSWLKEKLDEKKSAFVMFDCPGQVELYTHHDAFMTIVREMERSWHYRLCAVNLIDSFMCSDSGNFVSALLVALTTMMRLETPHINVLSKIDLVEAYGRLAFNLEFYTEVLDLSYLMEQFTDSPYHERYRALNEALIGLVEDFSLVQFYTLNVKDGETMGLLTRAIDKAYGYLYTSHEEGQAAVDNMVFTDLPRHAGTAAVAAEKYLKSDPLGSEEDLLRNNFHVDK